MRLRDRILLGPRWIGHAWRRSLTVRVVATTLIVSAVVVSVLGLLLLSRVTTGLLASRQSIAVSEAAAGLSEAQRVVDAASAGTTAPSPARLVDSVVTSLAARAGAPGQFDLLLLAVDPRPDTPERGTNRRDHLARHQPRDREEQDDENEACSDDGASDEIERALLLGEREQVVELIGPDAGDGERCPDDETRH